MWLRIEHKINGMQQLHPATVHYPLTVLLTPVIGCLRLSPLDPLHRVAVPRSLATWLTVGTELAARLRWSHRAYCHCHSSSTACVGVNRVAVR
jgi:hypothetical protein